MLSASTVSRIKSFPIVGAQQDSIISKLLCQWLRVIKITRPAIAQLVEHLTLNCAAIRWSLVRFRMAGFLFIRVESDSPANETLTDVMVEYAKYRNIVAESGIVQNQFLFSRTLLQCSVLYAFAACFAIMRGTR